MVVFDCEQGHCMCVDCFKEYCETKLKSRQFIQKPSIGYTLLCPNHCEGSEVREMHHFRMLGKELVSILASRKQEVLELCTCVLAWADCHIHVYEEHLANALYFF